MEAEARQDKISLNTSLRYLKGVGPERSKHLAVLGLETFEDALYFFPRRHEDRTAIRRIRDLTLGDKECVLGVVVSRGVVRMRERTMFRVVISDGTQVLFASWFGQPYLGDVLLPKTRVILYGKAEQFGKHVQMFHPEYEVLKGDAFPPTVHTGRIVPIYPLIEELNQKGLRKILFAVSQKVSALLRDPLSPELRKKWSLKERAWAVRQIHFPEGFNSHKEAYTRLVFDEFIAIQFLIQRRRLKHDKKDAALVHAEGEEAVAVWTDSLEFELTSGQKAAIRDVLTDMRRDRAMTRLVQGDVGSGKTVVAAAGLLFTVTNGFQGALMTPTDVLAQQHYLNLTRMLEPLGIRVGFLGQGSPPEERRKILEGIASGSIQIAVGTHALIQKEVRFKNLGLAVADEQHKFGIFQRAALKEKSVVKVPHFLLMTATPIPRTLAGTLYGELDISTMDELPEGRRPIRTLWVKEEKRAEIYRFVDRLIAEGRQAYVVCPSVDRSKAGSLKSVAETHKELSQIFGCHKVAYLHGRMKAEQKKKLMTEFKAGASQILVSTVVIEVGVDNPNASVMIVENADRFGLAQLHQLRGRVGRGKWDSFCILFSETEGSDAAERLSHFKKTSSGFEIAEKDLELRGGGDLVGRKQHGLPDLRIGDLSKDLEIFEKARQAAIELVQKDPELVWPEHRLLKLELQKRFDLKDEKLTIVA